MVQHSDNNGFQSGYTVWVHHGERGQCRSDVIRQRTDDGGGYNDNRIPKMVDDVRHAFDIPLEEEPEPTIFLLLYHSYNDSLIGKIY